MTTAIEELYKQAATEHLRQVIAGIDPAPVRFLTLVSAHDCSSQARDAIGAALAWNAQAAHGFITWHSEGRWAVLSADLLDVTDLPVVEGTALTLDQTPDQVERQALTRLGKHEAQRAGVRTRPVSPAELAVFARISAA